MHFHVLYPNSSLLRQKSASFCLCPSTVQQNIARIVRMHGGTTNQACKCPSSRSLHIQFCQHRAHKEQTTDLFLRRSRAAPLPNHMPRPFLIRLEENHQPHCVHDILLPCPSVPIPRRCQRSTFVSKARYFPIFPICWIRHHSSSATSKLLLMTLISSRMEQSMHFRAFCLTARAIFLSTQLMSHGLF